MSRLNEEKPHKNVSCRFKEGESIGTKRHVSVIIFGIILISMTVFLLITHLSLGVPIERVPLNTGFIGFVFILIDGFLLSYILIEKEVDATERLLISIGLGFGVTSLIMILLGILWEISMLTIILSQALFLNVLMIIALCKDLKPSIRKPSFLKQKIFHAFEFDVLKVILLTTICVYAIVAIYKTVAYPSVDWDSLAYGVNYARIIFEKGKIPLIAGPSIGLEMSANYPPGIQLIAVYLYVFAGNSNDFYYRILQPIFGLATLLATYKFAMLVTKNKTASVFAAFVLSAIPVFWELFIYETYLMYLAFMLTLGAYFFFKAYNSNDSAAKKYQIIGALFCGFSALVSYMGMFSFGILFLYAINRRLNVKRFVRTVILPSCVVLPWYVRDLLLLGNPVFPFFGIGNNLDPLLLSSSTQHFQNWLKVPIFDAISIISKVGAGILLVAIIYLTFAKPKHFLIVLPLYLLFAGASIMAVHLPFTRYLMMGLPAFAMIVSAGVKSLLAKHTRARNMFAIIVILPILISSVDMPRYMNSIKPTSAVGNNEWKYLSQVFAEADAWEWINENTPQNARIATYDIKDYYIQRDIMPLDGNESIPLYEMNTIQECINFLRERNVTYVLSVPWTAPSDTRMLPAYEWCVLTRYLGDPRYLPPVYVGLNGTAVYYVGPIEEKAVYASFSQEGFAPPIKHVKINLTITNETCPSSGRFYLPIPVDYREGLMMAAVNSAGHLVNVKLLNGILPENATVDQLETLEVMKEWPFQSINSSSVENPSFVWQVDNAGYFTFLIADGENTSREGFNVTVDIKFCNYWDIKSLFVPQGLETYNITMSNELFPLMKVLDVQVNKPSFVSINSTTFSKKICLAIFNDLIPDNAVINWSEQYEIVISQPDLNGSGEVDPSIQNVFLPEGNYSILVILEDNYAGQTNVLLEVKLTSAG